MVVLQARVEKNKQLGKSALGGVAVAALLLQGGIHLAAVLVATAVRELLHAQAGRPPLNHFDLHHAAAPLAHECLAGLVDINGGGAHQGAAVVVYHIDVGLALNLEFGAQRVHGPVGCGAAHAVAVLQVGADGVLGTIAYVVTLRVGVGGGAHHAVHLARVVERE